MLGLAAFVVAAGWSAFLLTHEGAWPGLVTSLLLVGVCFFMPKAERKAGVMIALAMLANWVWVQSTFSEHPPQMTLAEYGLKFKYWELWAFADACVGLLAIVVARQFVFCLPIVALICGQEGLHELIARGMEYDRYRLWLDLSWLAIVAVLFVRSWPGVADGIHNLVDRSVFFSRRVGLAKDSVK